MNSIDQIVLFSQHQIYIGVSFPTKIYCYFVALHPSGSHFHDFEACKSFEIVKLIRASAIENNYIHYLPSPCTEPTESATYICISLGLECILATKRRQMKTISFLIAQSTS